MKENEPTMGGWRMEDASLCEPDVLRTRGFGSESETSVSPARCRTIASGTNQKMQEVMLLTYLFSFQPEKVVSLKLSLFKK